MFIRLFGCTQDSNMSIFPVTLSVRNKMFKMSAMFKSCWMQGVWDRLYACIWQLESLHHDMIVEWSISWVDGDIRFIILKSSFWIVWQGHIVQWIRCFWRLQVQSQQHVRITRNTYDKWHLYPVMVNRIGTVYPCGSNKGFSSRFCVDSWVWHETPEEGRRTYRPKRCEYNNKDEVDGPNILNDI